MGAIIMTFFILVFSIPLRFLNLCYYFLVKNRYDFGTGLEFLYSETYTLIRSLKIEVLNRKIYLNGFNLRELCIKLLNTNEMLSEEQLIKGIRALARRFEEFRLIEKNYGQGRLFLTRIRLDKGVEYTKIYH